MFRGEVHLYTLICKESSLQTSKYFVVICEHFFSWQQAGIQLLLFASDGCPRWQLSLNKLHQLTKLKCKLRRAVSNRHLPLPLCQIHSVKKMRAPDLRKKMHYFLFDPHTCFNGKNMPCLWLMKYIGKLQELLDQP